ncbi:MAG: DsbA family protein [Actinomycetaceae bacterium]|nr:DsbA family protein [Actinomycetaceae bacterium]
MAQQQKTIKQGRKDKQWAKAQEYRAEQARKDRQRRLIIFGIIAAVLVIIIALVAGLMFGKKDDGTSAADKPTNTVQDSKDDKGGNGSELSKIENITFTKDGVKALDTDEHVVDLFFDYSCRACLHFEKKYSDVIFDLVHKGDIAFRIHPVNTHHDPYHIVAADALLKIARQQPDKAEEFHRAVGDHIFQLIDKAQGASEEEANKAFAFMKDADKSKQIIVDIAQRIGVSEQVIGSFNPDDTDSHLNDVTQQWAEFSKAHGEEQVGSPQIWYKGKKVEWGDDVSPEDFAKMVTQ